MKTIAVIPAFNEASTLRDVALRCSRYCDVVVVDDGSTDGTADSVAALPVTLLRNDNNRGKAGSLWRGFQHALAQGADAVITLDADGQHAPEEIPRLIEAAGNHRGRIVIAARLKQQQNAPRLRLFANRIANFWISWAAGYRIADTQSGFRLYPGALLRRLDIAIDRSRGFVFESEVLIEAANLGFHSVAVDIEAIYPRGARASHYRAGRDTLLIIWMVAKRLLCRGMHLRGLYRSLH